MKAFAAKMQTKLLTEYHLSEEWKRKIEKVQQNSEGIKMVTDLVAQTAEYQPPPKKAYESGVARMDRIGTELRTKNI